MIAQPTSSAYRSRYHSMASASSCISLSRASDVLRRGMAAAWAIMSKADSTSRRNAARRSARGRWTVRRCARTNVAIRTRSGLDVGELLSPSIRTRFLSIAGSSDDALVSPQLEACHTPWGNGSASIPVLVAESLTPFADRHSPGARVANLTDAPVAGSLQFVAITSGSHSKRPLAA